MYTRELPGLTLGTLRDQVDQPCTVDTIETSQLSVALEESGGGSIRWGSHEVPMTGAGLVAVGNWLDIPSKFLERLNIPLTQTLVNGMLESNYEEAKVAYNDNGVIDVYPVKQIRIPPTAVLDIASGVMSPDAQIVEYRQDGAGYGFEAIVPAGANRGIGGDSSVGDLTHGGLRFGQDTKHNLSPWVQEYTYRLVCSNGMEIPDPGLKISIRGNTLDQILEELEQKAEEAFGRVETTIDHFYDLRNERVARPEQTLARLAHEEGLTDKVLADMIRLLPDYVGEDGEASMFDLVNLITNEANAVGTRFGARRRLETVGGSVAYDHGARCSTCASKLS